MDKEKFESIVNEQIDLCRSLLCNKANEYATKDRLHNFKQAASLERTNPITALGGMMCKHTISIYDMIHNTEQGADYPLELWNEKITDSINYLLLLKALIIEEREGLTCETR